MRAFNGRRSPEKQKYRTQAADRCNHLDENGTAAMQDIETPAVVQRAANFAEGGATFSTQAGL
jgi:hypothetical protein